MFGIHPVKAVLVVLFGLVIELAFEIAVMLFLYTNDRLPERVMKGIRWAIKIFMAAFALAVVLYFG